MSRVSETPVLTSADFDWASAARQLRADGFCVVPGLLDSAFVARLKAAADRLGEDWTQKLGDKLKAQGSMIRVPSLRDPVFGELIACPAVLAAFERLALGDTRFSAGYVISKPGRSPPLFWHFDWYGWDDASSYEPEPKQLFAMYYLTDTRRENGCLRAIPGSHMRRHALHDIMRDGHHELSAAEDLTRPEFLEQAEEVAIPVRAGDVVFGDARLLHAAHANDTDARRSLVTLWYHPHFAALPERVQATFMDYVQDLPESWPQALRERVARLHPDYGGPAEKLPRTMHGPRA